MPTQPGPPLAEQGKYYWLNPPPPPHCFSVILLLYYFSLSTRPPLPVCEARCQPFPPLGTLPCPLCKCISAGPKLTTLSVSSSLALSFSCSFCPLSLSLFITIAKHSPPLPILFILTLALLLFLVALLLVFHSLFSFPTLLCPNKTLRYQVVRSAKVFPLIGCHWGAKNKETQKIKRLQVCLDLALAREKERVRYRERKRET